MYKASFIILLGVFVCFSIFLFWTLTVLLPVASIELTYQLKKTAMASFGTTDLRGFFNPQFRIGFVETSKYPNGSIVIPSLYMDEPLILNVNPNDEQAYTAALQQGIAHAAGTNMPGRGGLGYYFAHSSTPTLWKQYNAVFYLLGKLKQGQAVSLWYEGQKFDYTVIKHIITDPTDISFLTSPYPRETIVLQTCWPPGTTQKRLLVFAERI
jgi:LPXTG-site transpeptidase (sortase) family protein